MPEGPITEQTCSGATPACSLHSTHRTSLEMLTVLAEDRLSPSPVPTAWTSSLQSAPGASSSEAASQQQGLQLSHPSPASCTPIYAKPEMSRMPGPAAQRREDISSPRENLLQSECAKAGQLVTQGGLDALLELSQRAGPPV
ncbi:hypothetical protein GW7_00762 [Heterocephalus glaber]|uniref:Uncharacterized protein n=1 Tax=Heterocephalus glaber TaxID=10181 RepID=G5ANZ7_HETGA|nr:hypothetical protein GW7_00762 [Heterocephalus glaber]